MSIHPSFQSPVYVCSFLSVSLYVLVYLHLFVWLSIHLSVCLFGSWSISLSLVAFLSIYLYWDGLSVCLSLSFPVCLSAYVPVMMSAPEYSSAMFVCSWGLQWLKFIKNTRCEWVLWFGTEPPSELFNSCVVTDSILTGLYSSAPWLDRVITFRCLGLVLKLQVWINYRVETL